MGSAIVYGLAIVIAAIALGSGIEEAAKWFAYGLGWREGGGRDSIIIRIRKE